ncbi:hypothetical protein KBC51_00400 [Candidatus Saccharibacteria bacterium]|nr:hypothetical protein [Candidatus Saccharibacteria bacterium]
MLSKMLAQSKSQSLAKKQAEEYRKLIRREAEIGGKIFGPVPKGHRREFFCLDEHSWVWHEEWIDKSGIKQLRNTRYDVRPSGIVKVHNGRGYTAISPTEAKNLLEAVNIYCKKVKSELYGINP